MGTSQSHSPIKKGGLWPPRALRRAPASPAPDQAQLIHQLPEPGQGLEAASLTEREQQAGAAAPDPAAAEQVRMGVRADEREGHGGAAQDPSQRRGEVKDPRRGPVSGDKQKE
jgi:hypothetical protein